MVSYLDKEAPSCVCLKTNNKFVFIDRNHLYSDETPLDDERVFEHSDTDEMSENNIYLVPRGIVNPNYPGFQHLAHTLQVKHKTKQLSL